ncbi:hypothetical protein Q4602_12355 [Paraglaciecola chathamensis]|uniref:DUF6702 family protein n=1 Tax=Paraglaciecola chathamensis TaxID=368405 RepID=UPI002706F75E|nr:DUF6702 family protein [Paraglaciecola chathamensis]MDO6840267.1 hypothetical protein [Paraglaciecola chathamensis]
MFKLLTLTITGLLLIAASSVFAHQQKTAISTILFNPRTENIEVMHRFNLHDAEHAVRHIFGKNADIIGSNKTQQQFSAYVSQRFAMGTQDGRAISLKSAGFEIDGKFFWVYQETAEPEQLDNLVIKHNALRDLWPSQINTINVEGKGDIQTLTFEDSIELLKVEFDHH